MLPSVTGDVTSVRFGTKYTSHSKARMGSVGSHKMEMMLDCLSDSIGMGSMKYRIIIAMITRIRSKINCFLRLSSTKYNQVSVYLSFSVLYTFGILSYFHHDLLV